MQRPSLLTVLFFLILNLSLSAQAQLYCAELFSRPPSPKALFLEDEKDVASARLRFLQNETEEVAAAYYQMDGNKIGPVVFGELIAAKKRGARVRLLLDAWNPEDWIDQRLTPAMYKSLLEAGVEVRIFNLVDPSKFSTYLKTSSFNRMHDKLLILKGQNIVTEGDRNIQNSNFRIQLRKEMRTKSYRSVEVLVQDQQMTNESLSYFNEMWELGTVPDTSAVTEFELTGTQKKIERAFKIIRDQEDLVSTAWEEQFVEVSKIDFLHDDPSMKGQSDGIAEGILNVLSSAKKSIVIYSPYLYLTPRFKNVIDQALVQKVSVTFILPSWESIDTPFTMQHFEKQAAEMKAKGVNVRQHVGKDFMHAKMAIVDNEKVFIGSYNFNPRSEKTDYETGFVITDEAFAKTVVEFHENLLELESAPFTESNKTMIETIKIWFIRLFVQWVPLIGRQI